MVRHVSPAATDKTKAGPVEWRQPNGPPTPASCSAVLLAGAFGGTPRGDYYVTSVRAQPGWQMLQDHYPQISNATTQLTLHSPDRKAVTQTWSRSPPVGGTCAACHLSHSDVVAPNTIRPGADNHEQDEGNASTHLHKCS